jgi:hypothetical protein
MEAESNEGKLREAAAIYRLAGLHPDDQLDDLVGTLEAHELWSMRHVAGIIGVDLSQVVKRMTKTSRSGGRFNPATLPLILEEIELAKTKEQNPLLTAEIWSRGTSPGFLARLIGQPVSTVQWRAARGREEKEMEGSDG